MAIFHLHIGKGTREKGHSAERRLTALRGLGQRRDAAQVAAEAWGNLPEWAGEDPKAFFKAADQWERANAKLWIEIEGALPRELTQAKQCEIIREFIAEVAADRLPYIWTMRPDSKKGPQEDANPHFRAMIHERVDDRLPRTARKWFRRANTSAPGQGGAPKDRSVKGYDWVRTIRESYARILNDALARAGHAARVNAGRHPKLTGAAVSRRIERTASDAAPKPAGRNIGMAATHIERGRPGRPGRPSIRGQAERERVRRINKVTAEISRINDDIEALQPASQETRTQISRPTTDRPAASAQPSHQQGDTKPPSV